MDDKELEQKIEAMLEEAEFWMQSHKETLRERIEDIFLGFFLAWGCMEIFARIFPFEGISVWKVHLSFALLTTLGMTAVSFTRSYCMRRWHNFRNNQRRKQKLLERVKQLQQQTDPHQDEPAAK